MYSLGNYLGVEGTPNSFMKFGLSPKLKQNKIQQHEPILGLTCGSYPGPRPHSGLRDQGGVYHNTTLVCTSTQNDNGII